MKGTGNGEQGTEWNEYIRKHAPRSGAFLQSWEWGKFQKAAGLQVYRWTQKVDGRTINAAQVIAYHLPFHQQYLYCPRGPIVSNSKEMEAALAALRELGKKHGALFVRVEPSEAFLPLSATKTIAIQPEETLLLDLGKAEEELLSAMHPKTRYNIHVAERHGVTVAIEDDFDAVWPLFEKTGKRGGFHLHSRSHYEHLLRSLNTDACRAFLAVARHKGEAVAANIMIDCVGTRTYLHGASSDRDRNVMAPYLLHWHLIQDAKKKGLRWYDWWGVAPENAGEGHSWSGISRFKLGFGGERVKYPGTFDLVLKPMSYGLYRLARRLRRLT